jgi:hypothetical protein
MNIKTHWKQWFTVGVVAGATLLGAVLLAPQATFAQTDDSTGDVPAPQAAPWGHGGMKFGMGDFSFGGMRGEYQNHLAEALGITVEELQTAHLKAQDAMLDQAVEDGVIEQEQADLIKARRAFMQYYADQTEQSAEDALNAAVEAGAITQEQADLLLEQDGQMGRGRFGGGMFRQHMFGDGAQHRGMMPGRGHHMMPGYQAPDAPTATPEANS